MSPAVSVLNLFQLNDDSRRLGLMRGQFPKVRIAPVSNADHLSALSFPSRNLEQLQHVKSPGIEKEGMMPKQFTEVHGCRMILGKHLRLKLRQRLAYLSFVQLHELLLDFWHLNAVVDVLDVRSQSTLKHRELNHAVINLAACKHLARDTLECVSIFVEIAEGLIPRSKRRLKTASLPNRADRQNEIDGLSVA
jgi:hypothetical protein